MAKRANKPAEFPVTGITDTASVKPAIIGGATVGDTKPADRIEEPQGRDEKPSGFSTVSPIDLAGTGSGSSESADSGEPRRRRGRIPGSRNKETKAASDIITDLTGAICGFNSVLAALTHVPEFDVSKEQAEALSESVKNFAQHFSVKLDPVKLAGFQLFMTATVVYGPGVAALYKRSTRPALRIMEPRTSPAPAAAPAPTTDLPKVAEVPSQIWDGAPEDDLSLGTQ